jgi:hypothetical protein
MMTRELAEYIENIRFTSKIGSAEDTEIIGELESHIEDRIQELTDAGLSEEEATRTCLGQMGSPSLVARQIYEAYSQGTWKQVLMASLPHLLFGGIFVLNWWHHISWLIVLLSLTLGITIYGWCHGKPNWVFSWLSYSLIPVLSTSLLLVYLPKGWSLIVIPFYLSLAGWWLIHIVNQIIKKDWLFSSVMLLPIPIIVGWFFTICPTGKPTEASLELAKTMAPWIALSFFGLALTIAVFIRIRQRWLRIALLALSGISTLTLVANYTHGYLTTPMFAGLMLIMWGIFLIPPLLERRLRRHVDLLMDKKRAATTGVD